MCKTKIESIEIPDAVEAIDYGAFWNCAELKEVVIPNSAWMLGDFAFFDCGKLESVVMGNSVQSIGYVSFAKCPRLNEIMLPATLEYIDENVFNETPIKTATFGCSDEIAKAAKLGSLKEITLTEDVEDFTGFEFNKLGSLKTLNCYAENLPTLTTDQFSNSQYDNLDVHVPVGSLKAYEKATAWKLFFYLTEDLVADGINGIAADNSFTGKEYNLNGVEVGNSYRGLIIKNGKKYIRK